MLEQIPRPFPPLSSSSSFHSSSSFLSSSPSSSSPGRFILTISHHPSGQEKSIFLILNEQSGYAIESVCPHSGGPLHLGEILDMEYIPSVVCPFHSYSFDLVNGNCADAPDIRAETWDVTCDSDGVFWIDLEDGWICSAIKSCRDACMKDSNIDPAKSDQPETRPVSSKMDDPSNDSLLSYAVRILNTSNPEQKVALTFEAASKFLESDFVVDDGSRAISPPDVPPRETSSVHYRDAPRTNRYGSVKSRISILHNLANVELWAIDLCWDLIARFGRFSLRAGLVQLEGCCDFVTASGEGVEMPRAFFEDFVKMAAEEAKHHNLLKERLNQLGVNFGDLPSHGRLWDSAEDTSHSILCRMAIINMVHEARGLDVNPGTIAKFKAAQDFESSQRLEIIHSDEITHVARGQRWFRFICEHWQLDPYETFQKIVRKHFIGLLKPPFNEADRLKAGIDPTYYRPLSEKQ